MYILSAIDPMTGNKEELAGFSDLGAAEDAENELRQSAFLSKSECVAYGGLRVAVGYLRIDYVPEWEDSKVGA